MARHALDLIERSQSSPSARISSACLPLPSASSSTSPLIELSQKIQLGGLRPSCALEFINVPAWLDRVDYGARARRRMSSPEAWSVVLWMSVVFVPSADHINMSLLQQQPAKLMSPDARRDILTRLLRAPL
jgi:hypothetical protein